MSRTVREDEEPLGVDGLPPIEFDERSIGLDDEAASELGRELTVDPPRELVGDDDREGPADSVLAALDDDVARAGSWLQLEEDDVVLSELPTLAIEDRSPSALDDLEGPDDSAMVLGALPPIDRGLDDADGPVGAIDAESVALGGAPYAFSMRAPGIVAFVKVSDRDAEAFERARVDAMRRDDGDEGAGRSVTHAVRAGETLAFAFSRSTAQVSFDGGERFDDARWLDGATALAATEDAVFAAVYDSAVDRCTIVRARRDGAERIADLHATLSAVVDDDAGFVVRALVALDASRLLVRLASMSLVLSV